MIEINTLADIDLLAESSDLECKKAAGRDGQGELPKDFWESYSAMANTDGGTVLLGIRQKKDGFELSGIEIPGPEDVFDSPNLQASSPNWEPSSPNLTDDSPNSERDLQGRLVSQSHELPFVDDLQALKAEFLASLQTMAEEPRKKGRIPRPKMLGVLLALLDGQFITLSCLAELANRDPKTLREQYLSQMVRAGELEIAFPRTPNDPRQAYTKASK